MREQINNNPMVQIGLLAVLAIAAALMLLRGGSDETAAPAATPGADAATEAAAAPGLAEVEGVEPADVATPGAGAVPPAAAPQTSPPAKLVPGRGLPESFVKAYADNKVVVILFHKRKGVDDKRLRKVVEAKLSDRAEVRLFVERPKNISRYSRVTQGVGVDRVPALIVVKPRSRSDNTPVASVNYGFRGPKSVVTAVEDALYKGGQRTAAP